MCGIVGIVNRAVAITERQEIALHKMMSALEHRGPDGAGSFIHKNVALGHRRLSIVGLEDGNQPLIHGANPSIYAITYNGELYNYQNLREKLIREGYQFTTRGDTEVVLTAYQAWGTRLFEHLDAEFAFAIFDEEKDLVILARDRTGVKPLFYMTDTAGNLIFASEPKGILQYSIFPRVDAYTLAQFFMGSCTFALGGPAPDRSFFENMNSLPPGHYLIYREGKINLHQYWDFPFNDTPEETYPGEYVTKMRYEVEDSIKVRIPAEVKMGIALSGGLDSSIIACVAAQHYQPLLASVVSFQSGIDNDDYEHAKLLAEQKHISLFTSRLTAKQMIDRVDDLVLAMDEPHDSIAHLGMLANYRTLHEKRCKVVLIGEGADEINLGYYYTHPGFYADRELAESNEKVRSWYHSRAQYVSQYFNNAFLQQVNLKQMANDDLDKFYWKNPNSSPLTKMQYYYTKKFLVFLEKSNDRCAMSNSIECRLPFMSHHVIELSLSVPNKLNLQDGMEKMVLRKAFGDLLPQQISERKKSRFPAGDELVLHKLLIKIFDDNIEMASKSLWAILDKGFMLKLSHAYREKINWLEQQPPASVTDPLTRHLVMSKDIEIRTSHIFGLLTFMRWFHLYGVGCH